MKQQSHPISFARVSDLVSAEGDIYGKDGKVDKPLDIEMICEIYCIKHIWEKKKQKSILNLHWGCMGCCSSWIFSIVAWTIQWNEKNNYWEGKEAVRADGEDVSRRTGARLLMGHGVGAGQQCAPARRWRVLRKDKLQGIVLIFGEMHCIELCSCTAEGFRKEWKC